MIYHRTGTHAHFMTCMQHHTHTYVDTYTYIHIRGLNTTHTNCTCLQMHNSLHQIRNSATKKKAQKIFDKLEQQNSPCPSREDDSGIFTGTSSPSGTGSVASQPARKG